MVIAVDIRGSREYQHFIFETFTRITAAQPHHTFIFISGKSLDPPFNLSENRILEVVKETKVPLLSHLKVSSVLKKYKAGVFVTGEAVKTKVSQVLIVFENVAASSIKRTQVIITPSHFLREEIIEKYKTGKTRVDVIYTGADEDSRPLPIEKKEEIIEAYADGNEYFLSYAIPDHNSLLNLLKAFSIFKKMQKSGMQLLIVSGTEISKDFLEVLRLYKFKSEVNVFDNTGKQLLLAITGAAYAVVYPFGSTGYAFGVNAMKSNVPVITSKENEAPEILGEAALYVDPHDIKDIADKMMLIYKDENLRKQLIENGKEQVKKYTWERSAEQLWHTIQKAVD